MVVTDLQSWGVQSPLQSRVTGPYGGIGIRSPHGVGGVRGSHSRMTGPHYEVKGSLVGGRARYV